jgi:Uma2 family endonuclease
MAEPAVRCMNLVEFLRWEDGTDTRYELIGGFPVAMAPAAPAHGALCVGLGAAIDAVLRSRRPCMAHAEAGIVPPDRSDAFFVADLAVTCSRYERGEQYLKEPILTVEILSPGTERHDRLIKVPAYRTIDTVREILLIDSESIYAEILRRDGDRWITELVQRRDSVLGLSSIGVQIPMADLYEGIDVHSEDEA